MRLHYFCPDCWKRRRHEEAVAKPMPKPRKRCCFCTRMAVARAKTSARPRKQCKPGHIAMRTFARILDRAVKATFRGDIVPADILVEPEEH